MYEEYYGLKERPFSIAPDPDYLYLSRSHREALAHLLFGLSETGSAKQGGGFIVLTGEVGTGKTTLCRHVLQQLTEDTEFALILNPALTEIELLQTFCDELKISFEPSATQKQLLDLIHERLLTNFSEGKQTALIIDEAQLLARDVLELIRLLTNLETNKAKLLKIVLIGQPELADTLRREDLRQLAQRVTSRYHLKGLSKEDVRAYLDNRLRVAGRKQPLFSKQAVQLIQRLSQGIPRRINVLADQSVLAAFAKEKDWVDAASVRMAAQSVMLPEEISDNGAHSLMWRVRALTGDRAMTFFVGLNVLLAATLSWVIWGDQMQSAFKQAEYSTLTTPAVSQTNSSSQPTQISIENDTRAAPLTFETVAETNNELDVSSAGLAPDIDSPSELSEPLSGGVLQSSTFLDDSPTVSESVLSAAQSFTPIEALTPERLAEVLEAELPATTENETFKALMLAWGVSITEPMLEAPCDIAAAAGLRCETLTSIQRIREYNRPVRVTLRTGERRIHALVQAIYGDRLDLQIDGRWLSTTLEAFRRYWSQDALLLWKPSGFSPRPLAVGDVGEDVIIARERLEAALVLLYTPLDSFAEPDPSRYSEPVASAVQSMQEEYGLRADGVLGLETKLFINEVLSREATPVLSLRCANNGCVKLPPIN